MKKSWFIATCTAAIISTAVSPVLAKTEQVDSVDSMKIKKSTLLSATEQEEKDLLLLSDPSDYRVQEFDLKIAALKDMIKERQGKIETLQQKHLNLEVSMENIQKEIDANKLKFDNLMAVYSEEVNEIGFFDVVSKADGVGDFLDRVISYRNIAQEDSEFIKSYQNNRERFVSNYEKSQDTKKEIKKLHKEILTLQKQYKELSNDKRLYMKKISETKKESEELEIPKSEELEIVKLQENISEIENQAKIDKERQETIFKLYQKMAVLQSQNDKQETTSIYPYGLSEQNPVGKGEFLRPTTGTITSQFGQRDGKLHAGVDIGKNGRNVDVPIVAAADGVVIRSYYSSTYGNVVFIRHNINGKKYTTLYAHMENRAVKEGNFVKKGMFLGNMGNTGRSFGDHLHFEIHEGDWTLNKENAVNPLKFIPAGN